MAASYSAYAVIGVKVEAKKLYTKDYVRGCSCLVDTTTVHCPNCGKVMWVEEKIPIKGFNPEGGTKENGWNCTLSDLILLPATDRPNYIATTPTLYVCYTPEVEEAHRYLNSVDIDLAHGIFREILEPLGLWRSSKFGLWAIGHVSC